MDGVIDWSAAYLASLERCAIKTRSAAAAGIELRSVQRRRKIDPVFAAAELDAMEVATDLIESEILRRAIEGFQEPVFGSGGTGLGTVQVGTVTRYSDQMALRAAERLETGRWVQRQQVETGAPGAFKTLAELETAIANREAELARARAEIAEEEARENGVG